MTIIQSANHQPMTPRDHASRIEIAMKAALLAIVLLLAWLLGCAGRGDVVTQPEVAPQTQPSVEAVENLWWRIAAALDALAAGRAEEARSAMLLALEIAGAWRDGGATPSQSLREVAERANEAMKELPPR